MKNLPEQPVRLAGRALLIGLLALTSAFVFNCLRPEPLPWNWRPLPPSIPLITDINELRKALGAPETVLVDARDPLFFEMGHLPAALNLPADETGIENLELWAATLPPDAGIIIYCSDEFCSMAEELADKMTAAGLAPRIFSPGFSAWEAEGLPLESLEAD